MEDPLQNEHYYIPVPLKSWMLIPVYWFEGLGIKVPLFVVSLQGKRIVGTKLILVAHSTVRSPRDWCHPWLYGGTTATRETNGGKICKRERSATVEGGIWPQGIASISEAVPSCFFQYWLFSIIFGVSWKNVVPFLEKMCFLFPGYIHMYIRPFSRVPIFPYSSTLGLQGLGLQCPQCERSFRRRFSVGHVCFSETPERVIHCMIPVQESIGLG